MKKIYIFIIVLAITVIQLSCEKSFLDLPAVGTFDETSLSGALGINGLLTGAYADMNGYGSLNGPDLQIISGMHGMEVYKGSTAGDQNQMLEFLQMNVTTGNGDVSSLWRSYYTSVGKCNIVLRLLPKATGLTDDQKVQIEAEARFLRAHYYSYLKRFFKNIPWLDETTTDARVPNTENNDGVTYVDIWPQITADMDFARKNLPATQTDLGKPNKWAADIYYAKLLIYRACEGEYTNGFDEALPILTNAITNGVNMKGVKYDLLPNYHDLFDAAYEHGPEWVWDAECSVNDGIVPTGSGGNTVACGNNVANYTGSNNSAGPNSGRGLNFAPPTPWYADHFRTNGKGLPYLDMFTTFSTRLKTDYGQAAAPAAPTPDPFVVDTMGVDPRLDWNVGRRKIPFLDWGDFPGKSWIRSQDHGGPYMMKKWNIWKSQVGTYSPTNSPSTAINVPIIRFADVLLLAAECEAQVGSLANARTLVNRVRQRMVSNSTSYRNWVKRPWNGTVNAANYRISIYPAGGAYDPFQTKAGALTAILYERTLELGSEGQRYYDLVRFGKVGDEFAAFQAAEQQNFDFLKSGAYSATDAYLPIPQTAVDNSQKEGIKTLTQNPGY